MPIPRFTGLPIDADYDQVKNKTNELVQQLQQLLLNLDSLNVVSLTADHVDTGTLDANLVTIRSDLTGGAYITLDGNGIVINDGTQDTFVADSSGNVSLAGHIDAASGTIGGWTIEEDKLSGTGNIQGGEITGSTIQTREEGNYPRVALNPDDDLLEVQRASDSYINIGTQFLPESPTIHFRNSITNYWIGYWPASSRFVMAHDGSTTIEISSGIGDILLRCNNLEVPDWDDVINNDTNETLQEALNDKADAGIGGSVTVGDGSGGTKILNFNSDGAFIGSS